MEAHAVGIDLGGTNIKAALVCRSTGVVEWLMRETGAELGPAHVLDQMTSAARELQAFAPGGIVTGIGIGAPGTVDLGRTTLIHPPNIPGWDEINLRTALQEKLGAGLDVVVENDANAAALGSSTYGAGRPYPTFLMVTLGTGVGGAIIVNNKVFRGTTGAAGEIGHMTIDYGGPKDQAGVAGAIEAYVGQRYLTAHARTMLAEYTQSLLYGMAGKDLADLTPAMLTKAAVAGDTGATAVLAWAGRRLGCVLGSCVNLLDIRVIVVGGGVSKAGEFLLEPARKAMLQYIKPGMREDVTVVRETLGNEAGMLGAAALVFEHADMQGHAKSGP